LTTSKRRNNALKYSRVISSLNVELDASLSEIFSVSIFRVDVEPDDGDVADL
jgi:hypothetical protein